MNCVSFKLINKPASLEKVTIKRHAYTTVDCKSSELYIHKAGIFDYTYIFMFSFASLLSFLLDFKVICDYS